MIWSDGYIQIMSDSSWVLHPGEISCGGEQDQTRYRMQIMTRPVSLLKLLVGEIIRGPILNLADEENFGITYPPYSSTSLNLLFRYGASVG